MPQLYSASCLSGLIRSAASYFASSACLSNSSAANGSALALRTSHELHLLQLYSALCLSRLDPQRCLVLRLRLLQQFLLQPTGRSRAAHGAASAVPQLFSAAW